MFADRALAAGAQQRIVSAAEVVAGAPEVVLASWCGEPFDRGQFESRPGFATLPALRAGRVHELDPSVILQPGAACLTDGLDLLERLLAP